MYLRIPVVDVVAYKLMQMVMLFQAIVLEIWYRFNPPEGLRNEIEAMSNLHSSYYLATVDLNELPEMIQDKVLMMGRILLLIIVIGLYMEWVKLI